MKPVLTPLTSFRFFAAAAVVMYHRPRVGTDDWFPYEGHGKAGVAFFFLLSGFILTYTYHDRFLSRRPGVGRDFLVARAARILPAYLLAFVLALWVTDEGRNLRTLRFGSALWSALTHLTLTQAWIPKWSVYSAFNGPAWSLSCEWFFYLTFPLLLLGLATGSLLRRVAVFAAFSAPWAAALGLYLADPTDPVQNPLKWMWLGYVSPLTRVFDFACGVALGVLFVRFRPAVGPARGWRYCAWGFAELGALAALWAALHFCPVVSDAGPAAWPQHLLAGLGYYLPAFALVVWVGALGRGPLSRAVSWSPLVYLGELSYGIYIFHVPLFQLVSELLGIRELDRSVHVATALNCALTIGAAALSYHFWETPIRRWVRGRPAQPAAAGSSATVLPLPQHERRAA